MWMANAFKIMAGQCVENMRRPMRLILAEHIMGAAGDYKSHMFEALLCTSGDLHIIWLKAKASRYHKRRRLAPHLASCFPFLARVSWWSCPRNAKLCCLLHKKLLKYTAHGQFTNICDSDSLTANYNVKLTCLSQAMERSRVLYRHFACGTWNMERGADSCAQNFFPDILRCMKQQTRHWCGGHDRYRRSLIAKCSGISVTYIDWPAAGVPLGGALRHF
jgi:hypothetical protein